MNDKILKKEDYEEPCCPLKAPTNVVSVPIGRVIEKLDSYFAVNDYDSARRHLEHWLREAALGNDERGTLSIINEQIGLYRKCGLEKEALNAADTAVELACKLSLDGTVTMATTLINAATAYKAFGKAEKAIPLFDKAKTIYEDSLSPDDEKLGALYNNMALAVSDTENYEKAEELFGKALEIMARNENAEAQMAITYCNLADLTCKKFGFEDGEKEINRLLETALDLLNRENLPHDGAYAFVCEKCAPTFGYYGFFLVEKELSERAKKIYERA